MKTPFLLWADDDFDDRILVRDAISECNFDVILQEASNGQEVMDFLNNADKSGLRLPDLLVLDINMPVLCGKQTLQQVKKHPSFREIHTIIFTTSRSEKDREYCQLHGAEMISKPATFGDLKMVITKMLLSVAVSN